MKRYFKQRDKEMTSSYLPLCERDLLLSRYLKLYRRCLFTPVTYLFVLCLLKDVREKGFWL